MPTSLPIENVSWEYTAASTCRSTQKWLIHNTLLITRRLLTHRRRMPRYRGYVVTVFGARFGVRRLFGAPPLKGTLRHREKRRKTARRPLTNETILISDVIRHRWRIERVYIRESLPPRFHCCYAHVQMLVINYTLARDVETGTHITHQLYRVLFALYVN